MNPTQDQVKYALAHADCIEGMEINDAESGLVTLASVYRLEKNHANLLERQYHEIIDWAWANIPQSGNVEWDRMIDRHTIERNQND